MNLKCILRATFLFLFAVTTIFCLAISAYSQEKSTESAGPEKTITTVYVPFDKLQKTFEQNGRGVFLPYDQFQKLWDAAQTDKQKPLPKPEVPISFMINEIISEANIVDEIVQVESKIRIELLKNGWLEIPLKLSDAAITSAEIDGQPARILGETGKGFRLLIESKITPPAEQTATGTAEAGTQVSPETQKPEAAETAEALKATNSENANSILLVLKYAKKIDKSPGRNSVSFEIPQAPINRWTVRIPESDVKVDIAPLIAATEEKNDKNETVLLAFLGTSPVVRIGWTPKAEGATGLDALIFLQMDERVQIEDGVVRTEARLDYTISRSPVERLSIEVPNDQKVVELLDANVRQWSVNQGEHSQTINVELFEPAKNQQSLILKLERFVTPEDTLVTIPTISGVGVSRQQGVLLVRSAEELSTDVKNCKGLMQIDPNELEQPVPLSQQRGGMGGTNRAPGPNNQQVVPSSKWDYAYQLSSANYELELQTSKVKPRITAEMEVAGSIGTRSLRLDINTVYNIERAGVFSLEFDIPNEYHVGNINNSNTHGNMQQTQRAEIESTSIDRISDTTSRLKINLSRRAIGTVAVKIGLTKEIDGTNLLTSTGKQVDIAMSFPHVAGEYIESCENQAFISADSCLRVTLADSTGMQTIPLNLARQKWTGQSGTPTIYGFMFGKEEAKAEFKVERRKPQVTVQELLSVNVADGVVKYTDKISFDVLYSGIKSLRIDVPEKIADKIRNLTSSIRDSKMIPQPEDVERGYVAMVFEFENDFIGNGNIELTWEDEMKQLDVGKSVGIPIPRLIPRNVDRSFGHILISKSQTIDLGETDETQGLRAVDPQHDIPAASPIVDATAAFEFYDKWALELIATRYKNEDMKQTSIEDGLLEVVSVRNSNMLTARGVYRMRSVKQRLQIELPQDASVLGVKINGKAVVLESADATSARGNKIYMIPLNAVVPDTPFVFEIRYSYPGSVAKIEIPKFPGEMNNQAAASNSQGKPGDTATESKPTTDESNTAVQQMYVLAYVPEEKIVTGFKGPWSPGFQFTSTSNFNNTKTKHDISGVETMRRVAMDNNPTTFPVDGNIYVFSALQPGCEPDDALRLSLINENLLKIIAIIIIGVMGVVLVFYSWSCKLKFVFAVAVVMLVFGVFCPTLMSYFVCQSVFESTILLVAALWVLAGIFECGKGIGQKFLSCCTRRSSTCDTNASSTESNVNEKNDSADSAHSQTEKAMIGENQARDTKTEGSPNSENVESENKNG
ncbi:MAG: hypothetical protein ACRC2T_15325 [Thermoguttaceae bacterium]